MPNDATSAPADSGNLPPFALPQSVFMLSLASNVLFGQVLNLQKKINDYLGVPGGKASGHFFDMMNTPNPKYQCLTAPPAGGKPDWKTVWGPGLFRAKFNPGATNAVFVAHSAALKVYVVAIAGTNPLGVNALLFQDLDVEPEHMKAWPPTPDSSDPLKLIWQSAAKPAPAQPALAEGTSEGLERLYELEAPSVSSAQPMSLKAFLKSVEDSASTLIFTGHSLGGALSPMLALLLYPQLTGAPAVWQDVHILATAGPTPGNKGLADLFSTAYQPRDIPAYQPVGDRKDWVLFTSWNVNYANVFDVVPMAWSDLSGLVTKPNPATKLWPSFFAGGAKLEPLVLGPEALRLTNKMTERAGYRDGRTPFYSPAVPQVSFTGQWGGWKKDSGYPPVWEPNAPEKVLLLASGLTSAILNAHLPQYPYAFLGANAPAIKQAAGGLFGTADVPGEEEAELEAQAVAALEPTTEAQALSATS